MPSLRARLQNAVPGGSAALATLVDGLFDAWIETADEQSQGGNVFGYAGKPSPHRLLHMPLAPEIPNLSVAAPALRSGAFHARRGTKRRAQSARPEGRENRQCGRSRMSKNAQRLSQVISTFGPGAMIDLPDTLGRGRRPRSLGNERQCLHHHFRASADHAAGTIAERTGPLGAIEELYRFARHL